MDGAAAWRALAGLGGKLMSWVRAMYWMRSTWCASPSSWSMLSLAARWRWKWRLFGEPSLHTWGVGVVGGGSGEPLISQKWEELSRHSGKDLHQPLAGVCPGFCFIYVVFQSEGKVSIR